ncbi:MAG: preprotein translocase subunit SecA [Candidatus Omnitrophica bacterium]|nr:preprotein translocase subunit SecA [Candidatus Omnitrophota bacterium]
MFKFLLNKISGSQSERIIRRFKPVLDRINMLEGEMSALSDEQLRDKTEEFRKRIEEKSKDLSEPLEALEEQLSEMTDPKEKQNVKAKIRDIRNKALEDILPDAFALVREAARRTIGLRHHDVQLIGGLTLHYGIIAEMANGEGKTLVATLPAYLNALSGRGVHIVTVNDYLAKRDRDWMGPVYEALGLSVGVIQHDMRDRERQAAYASDITYGTNNEFGFDYLRDNMKFRKADMVQREFHFAIVDEVDSILVDEARTPLIISGPAEEATDKYYQADKVARRLKGKKITDKEEIEAKYKEIDLTVGVDFIVKEKEHLVFLTDEGEKKAAHIWGVDNLSTIETMPLKHLTQQSLRAHNLFERDVDYIVEHGQVVIIDEFTGRLMPGRRWSDGLHQAIEAKEGVKIERENQTLATITFQNYFRMYEKLSGMSGTVATEAQEFYHIYNLDVVCIPTYKPTIRDDSPDVIYKTEKEKFNAICNKVAEYHKKGLPVLVGTTSVEKNKKLSRLLSERDIEHEILNAEDEAREARIISEAGREGRVTVATNMAGRGTDIKLGGDPPRLKDAVLANIICEASLKIVSKTISSLKQPEDRFDDLLNRLLAVTSLHDKVYRNFVDKQAESVSSFLLNFDADYSALFAASLESIVKLKEILIAEQKNLAEIFSVVDIDQERLKGVDKIVGRCKNKVDYLQTLYAGMQQNIKGFVEFCQTVQPQLKEAVELIAEREDQLAKEIELLSGGKQEDQKEQTSNETISSDEMNRLSEKLKTIEQQLGRIEGDFKSNEEFFLNLTKQSKEFWELVDRIERLGREHFDSRGISLQEIKKNVLGKWRPIAYSRKLGEAKKQIDMLKDTLQNRFENIIYSVIGEIKKYRILEDIKRSQEEFQVIEQDLRRINLLSREEIMSRDLTKIKDFSSLSSESREKIGILSEKMEVYVKEREQIVSLGGLQVLGTERHESRRIDNQLRGRSGRHGAPGSSQFYLSLEDDLMRIFASDKISKIMDFMKWEESIPIEHPLITRSIETAQKRVEQHNFDIRKQLLEYDNVMNTQREAIYDERRLVLNSNSLKEHILEMIEETADSIVGLYANENVDSQEWNIRGLKSHLRSKFLLNVEGLEEISSLEQLSQEIRAKMQQAYEQKEAQVGSEHLQRFAQIVLLQVIDAKWKDHLYSMDHLREGIGLRGYAGHVPLVEYQREGYDMFRQMTESIKNETLEVVFRAQPLKEEKASTVFAQTPQRLVHPESARIQDLPRPAGQGRGVAKQKPAKTAPGPQEEKSPQTFKREGRKIGRNEPCPCGSGKKYKKCCGREAE